MNQSVSRRELARVITTKLLTEPTKQSHWLKTLAAYIVEHRLIDELDLLVNDIAHELFEQAGHLTVEVVSAKALTATVRDDVKKYLKEMTDAKHVVLHESVDPELIGGLVARTADAELDTTVKKALRQLAAAA